tara:strand:- start:2415 stop:6434 length:4020 start_codon:yes stop_codon:yes gene_type:complete
MANVTVTTSFSNVQVSESNANVINVTTTPSNITVTSGSTVSQDVIRNALSNVAPVTYDTANGVIGFESTEFTTDITTTANVTAATFKGPGSNASSIAWNDNLELWNLQGNILRVANNSSLTGAPVSTIDPGHAVMIGYDDFGSTPAKANLHMAGNIIYSQGNAHGQFSIGFISPGGASHASARQIVWPGASGGAGNIEFQGGVNDPSALIIDFDGSTDGKHLVNMDGSNVIVHGLTVGDVMTSNSNITTTAGVTADGDIRSNAFLRGDGRHITNLPAAPAAPVQSVNGQTGNVNLSTTNIGEGTNLYFTDARANAFIEAYSGNLENIVGDVIATANITGNLIQATGPGGNVTAGGFFKGDASLLTNIPFSAFSNSQVIANIAAVPLVVGGNLTVNGNIDATGNINYQNVTDLYVTDQKITLNANATADATVEIISNRPQSTHNAIISWNEPSEKWTFMNGDNVYQDILTTAQTRGLISLATPATPSGNGALAYDSGTGVFTLTPADVPNNTDELSEGSTNEYFTTARANSAIGAYTGNLTAVATTGNITTTANVSAGNVLGTFIGNITGNVTGAPSSLAGLTTADLAENTNLYYTDARFDTRLASKSTSNLTEGTNLYYTTARANSAIAAYTGNLTAVNTTGNITTTANASVNTLLTDNVNSGASANLNLLGQQNGVHLNKTVDSVTSRILDVDTTGYAITEPTLPATTTLGGFAPTMIVSIDLTNGSSTAVARDLYSGALAGVGLDAAALRGPNFSSSLGGTDLILTTEVGTTGKANVEAAFTTTGVTSPFIGSPPLNGIANVSANLYGQDKGWTVSNLTDTTELFPFGTYITGMSGKDITFSQNATGATGIFSILLSPGIVQSTDANTQLKYQTTIGSNSVINAGTLYGRFGSFEHAETLANSTYDAVSYGNTSSIAFTAIGTKQSADMIVGTESATRYPRLLTVGPSTTPDPFSARVTTNLPAPIGVTVEDDGHTYAGVNAPYSKFLFNQYTGNFDDLTALPNYITVGSTGNATLDLPQVKAPSLQFKTHRGAKNTGNTTSYLMQAGEVVGKVSFSPGQTTGSSSQGADLVNPPSAITVDVGSANINTGAANTHMHITTSPYPAGGSLGYFRNNANADTGINQQTNFTTKDGNVTIAAQTDGMITLAPTPDYGDSANATVWTRFPGTTHGFHTFLDAKFLSSKAGTIVEIQPKSGTTTGSGGLGYDSVGNSTVRLSSHHSNSAVKAQWDITNEQSSGNLVVRSHTGSKNYIQIDAATGIDLLDVGNIIGEGSLDISTTSTNPIRILNNGLELAQKTTTEINAIGSPRTGSMYYNTTLNLIVFYNGTGWRKINDASM